MDQWQLRNIRYLSKHLHLKIKELITEKQFTEERLVKALAYYEVGSIEELGWEGAHHFTQQLLKL
jgi:hypothetical protein